jgi:hypothetical protein
MTLLMLLPLREMKSFIQRQFTDLLLLPVFLNFIMTQLAYSFQGRLEFINQKFT